MKQEELDATIKKEVGIVHFFVDLCLFDLLNIEAGSMICFAAAA